MNRLLLLGVVLAGLFVYAAPHVHAGTTGGQYPQGVVFKNCVPRIAGQIEAQYLCDTPLTPPISPATHGDGTQWLMPAGRCGEFTFNQSPLSQYQGEDWFCSDPAGDLANAVSP